MLRVTPILGWILAAVAVGTAAVFIQQSARYQAKAAHLQARLDEMTKNVVRKDQAAAMEILALKKRIADLTSGRPEAGTATDATEVPGETGDATGPGAGGASGADFAGNSTADRALAKGIADDIGRQLVRSSVRMGYELQYDQFFKKLNLSPEVEKQVEAIVTRNIAAMIGNGFNLLGAVPAEKADEYAAARQKLRDELGTVLTPEQMTEWDTYNETMPEQIVTSLMDNQLARFVPELTPENRARTTTVMLEELIAIRNETGGQGRIIELLQAGLDRSRERLAQEFTPEQLAHLDRFLAQQGQAVQQGLRMLDSLSGRRE